LRSKVIFIEYHHNQELSSLVAQIRSNKFQLLTPLLKKDSSSLPSVADWDCKHVQPPPSTDKNPSLFHSVLLFFISYFWFCYCCSD
jgi:hypothetical protein